MSTPTQQPLLRDVIDIPEGMSDSDLVLELASGISKAEETLREYVITESLVKNFDQALGLIKSAVTGQASKAAYLHGSFGAGKSHFMAVLHALLRGEKAARERTEFAGLLAKHDWMEGRRFLLVPLHLLGAKSLEQRVFGRYIDYVRVLHPDAPIPAVHRTDALLDQARFTRRQVGDEAFIAGLPGGEEEEDEWGESVSFWTPEKLDAAFAGAHSDELRRRLVNDLLQSWNKGFFRDAKEDAEAFVSLDAGLKEISRHAREIGYDSLILFLDELVLWLINSAGDAQFVSREMQKITNFVESGDPDRPAPVVSFIARQRDLREALGEQVTGTTELSILDTLDLAKARFDTITLEDRNLPVIARERVLRRREPAAESDAAIARAFDQATKLRQQVWDTLLGSGTGTGADIEAFRKTYPFSPAFMDTLVHLSAALQRSRTALKLMRRLLIRRRDELRLGQLIPLGDLYDVITEGGDEPFTQKLKVEFEAAQKLYGSRLRPYLLDKYGLTEDDVARARKGQDGDDPEKAAKAKALAGDDRLMKTLLLSALAPTVPALHNLTAGRLAALNHGSFVSPPIPGMEVTQVARKVEEWAGRFTEIKFVKGDDPGVGLELVGVDVESILSTARFASTEGAWKSLVKRLLYTELGVAETGQYSGDRFDLTWRGSRRSVEVVFGNVRDEHDLRDDAFQPADPTAWRVVIDYPFDSGDHTPADDRNRIQSMIARGVHGRTVAWVPASLSVERMQDLRQLVILDYVLSGQRFDEHAGHLNPTDRHRARQTLTEQRNVLQGKLTETLRQAYGLTTKQSGDVVTGFDDHLFSLEEGLRPRLASGAKLSDAMRSLADQMLAVQFPAHPDFDLERTGVTVKPAELKTVLEYVRRAAEKPGDPLEVDKPHRAIMRRIANPLLIGEMHDAKFVLGSYWRQHFHQQAHKEGVTGDLRLAKLLDWIDLPDARGLEKPVAHLVVACFAEQTDRAFVHRGVVERTTPELNQVKDDMALRDEPLPGEETWEAARLRAMEIFGLNPPQPRKARLVAILARQLCEEARRHTDDARRLVGELEAHEEMLGLDPAAERGRLHTARIAADLLDGLAQEQQERLEVIRRIAGVDGPAQYIGKSIKSAAAVCAALRNAPWENFRLIASLGDPHREEAERILARLRETAAADEFVVGLGPALSAASKAATELLSKAIGPGPQPPQPPKPPKRTGGTATVHITGLAALAEEIAAKHPGATVKVTWEVVEP
ncbi:phage resistance protein [Planomonospora parontospora]|uniref:phage resistance protein n=1 Tax=Planomonospora parontospora TaxID=58119 RepID=UPI001670A1FF|nr:phage resistance protein [Planomonospora parontospora]GGL15875.1 hypothetical protein GCM10014719_17480 [Planomonospora parontospora subsp. antibiotica]GII15441.1 hypothetical protein Ppa05_21670 [Planomonospora parontospora subsp. antibiotica]